MDDDEDMEPFEPPEGAMLVSRQKGDRGLEDAGFAAARRRESIVRVPWAARDVRGVDGGGESRHAPRCGESERERETRVCVAHVQFVCGSSHAHATRAISARDVAALSALHPTVGTGDGPLVCAHRVCHVVTRTERSVAKKAKVPEGWYVCTGRVSDLLQWQQGETGGAIGQRPISRIQRKSVSNSSSSVGQ
eukprot:5535610-Prymnesium_polylepis.1